MLRDDPIVIYEQNFNYPCDLVNRPISNPTLQLLMFYKFHVFMSAKWF